MHDRWRRTTSMNLSFMGVFAPFCCCFFFLAFDARLLVILSAAGFSQNAILLNPAVEPFESCFERIVFADLHFRHQGSPPLWPVFEAYRVYIYVILNPPWTCGKIIVQALSHVKIFWEVYITNTLKDCALHMIGVQC
jgi:hypothetical protein